VPQLLRDNAADDRVTADIERLAGAYNDDAVAAVAANAAEARAADLALLSSHYEAPDVAGALWWRPALVHLNRYRTLYVAAALVLGVLVLRNPVPLPVAEAPEETTTVDVGNANAASAPAPFDATPFSAETGPFALAPADEIGSPLESSTFGIAPAAPPAAIPLSIMQSGYASTFGGTPLEQPPPNNGLPVQSLAGGITKMSYVRLSGTGRSLRLTMLTDSGANTNDAAARVQACHITTAGWAPTRGAPMDQAPKYDAGDCVEGARVGAVWTFTFVLTDPVDRNGWALVPVTTGSATFEVTFSPNSV
jgi:hypothetical protein